MCFSYIGVVSDTHNSASSVEEALRKFRDYGVEFIIHCGDVTSPEVAPYFGDFKTHYVMGNCDSISKDQLQAAIRENNGEFHGISGEILWNDKKIFFTHGHDEQRLKDAILSEEYDLVCYGHHHVFYCERAFEGIKREKTLILNPGALQYGGSYCIVSGDLEVERFDLRY